MGGWWYGRRPSVPGFWFLRWDGPRGCVVAPPPHVVAVRLDRRPSMVVMDTLVVRRRYMVAPSAEHVDGRSCMDWTVRTSAMRGGGGGTVDPYGHAWPLWMVGGWHGQSTVPGDARLAMRGVGRGPAGPSGMDTGLAVRPSGRGRRAFCTVDGCWVGECSMASMFREIVAW